MADRPPRSTLDTEGNPSHRKEPRSHDGHQGFHQEPPTAELLRTSVRHLVGRRTLGHRWTWRYAGHRKALRDAAPHRGPGDARRVRRSRHPLDRPRRWEGWPAQASIPVAKVAGWRSLVGGSAPNRPALYDGGTPCALADLPRVPLRHIRIR